MLSTLALRKAGLKALHGVRVFSVTPARLSELVAQKEPPKELFPFEADVPSSDVIPQTLEQKVQNWKNANDIFFGPDRDFKNFPHPEYKVEPSETYQLAFIPTSMFKALYPKLGVSGGYTLVWGTILMMCAKEIIVGGADLLKLLTCMGVLYYATHETKLGQMFRDKLDTRADQFDDFAYYEPLKNAKKTYLEEIATINNEIERKQCIPAIFEAKQEQLDLQLELEYRQRLRDLHIAVKNRLDYQADIAHAERQFEQDHMVNWIVSSVKKSITPQQEKETITSCIQTLKNLSATATI